MAQIHSRFLGRFLRFVGGPAWDFGSGRWQFDFVRLLWSDFRFLSFRRGLGWLRRLFRLLLLDHRRGLRLGRQRFTSGFFICRTNIGISAAARQTIHESRRDYRERLEIQIAL